MTRQGWHDASIFTGFSFQGGGEENQEITFGEDSRTPQTSFSGFPYTSVCSIEIRLRGRSQFRFCGTGWLYRPTTVVTAGHCLLHPGLSDGTAEGIVEEARLYFGREPNATGELRTSKRFAVPREWREAFVKDRSVHSKRGVAGLPALTNASVSDFAVIEIDEVAKDVIAVAGDEALSKQEIVAVLGYPGDRQEKKFSTHSNGDTMYLAHDRLTDITESTVSYTVDTSGGQSGSPVYIYRDGEIAVAAVHAYGMSRGNYGRRCNASWIEKTDSLIHNIGIVLE